MNRIKHIAISAVCLLMMGAVEPLQCQPVNQTTIQGSVIDVETGNPIQNVQVYLSGTTSGTVTDMEGQFEFPTGLSGNQQLVFSFVGYRTESAVIDLGSRRVFTLDVGLVVEILELDEVSVSASSDNEWQQNFEIFRRQFIGTSPFAEMTEILNPWHIEFTVDRDGHLIASASEPIVMENAALGYRIHAELVDFSWMRDSYHGYYVSHIRFEEMEPENDEQLNRWVQHREEAYQGSLRHFLHSLYNDRLEDEDFRITRTGRYALEIDLFRLNEGEVRLYLLESGRSTAEYAPIVKGFRFRPIDDGMVSVYYIGNDDLSQHSTLTARRDDDTFFVTESGELLEARSLAVSGVWSQYRMAEFLPYDYRPF